MTGKRDQFLPNWILVAALFGGSFMQLYLVDSDGPVATALCEAFSSFPEVAVTHADLLDIAQNTVVSPANSHGFMDGGIDAAFRSFFGVSVELTVQR